MPSGKHLTKELRLFIVDAVLRRRMQSNQIYQHVFGPNNPFVKAYQLEKICRSIRNMNSHQIHHFLKGPARRGGRHCKLDRFTRDYWCGMMRTRLFNRLTCLRSEFLREFYGQENGNDVPSYETLRRIVKCENFTFKKVERRNIAVHHNERFAFSRRIAYLHPHLLIDVDETAASEDQFLDKYGWAPRGTPAFRTQFRIGSRHFSVIAAYSIYGFVYWEMFEGGVDSDAFIRFLQNLAPFIDDETLLIDNARIHKTGDALIALEVVSHGNYQFAPRYSPDLKPIEKGFSLVKRWLREHEAEAIMDPFFYLDLAFRTYALGSVGAEEVATANWSFYFRLHDEYIENFEEWEVGA